MTNINKICDFFQKGISDKQTLGVELEHFICDENYKNISYEDLLECMQKAEHISQGRLICDQGFVIGMECEKYGLSLEPAGQLEISIFPTEDLEEIDDLYGEFRRDWEEILKDTGYRLLEGGLHPLVESGEKDPGEFPLIPKKRYEYMDAYFRNTGKYGRYMMRATASTQISVDYSSEADAMRKLRILTKIAPIFSLWMENHSGLGVASDFHPHLLRTQIWNDVDSDRCGYLEGSLEEDYSFEACARALYEKPMIFLKDQGEEVNVGALSAKNLCKERPFTFVEHMLSMFFPHIRLKKYLEIRVADSVSKERMLGYGALLKGLLYSEKNLARLEQQLEKVTTLSQVQEAEKAMMKEGYYAKVYGKTAVEWMFTLYEMAKEELSVKDQSYLKGILTLPVLEYEYRKDIEANRTEHEESAWEEKQYILNSTAKYHSRVPRTMYIPKMFMKDDIRRFDELTQELFGIFDKVIAEYKKNPEYRRLFGFDEKTEELILKEEGYTCNVPMARIDFFYNEETKEITFCEFNTDGTSAMNEDRELNHGVKLTKAHQDFVKEHETYSFELFDTWVDEFLSIYGEYAKKYGKDAVPNVVITDFLDHGTVTEFEIFQKRFMAKGIPCEICDIADFVWNGTSLSTPSGMRVDAIYRRAVTSDILQEFDKVPAFIQAVKANAVCLVGEFRTQIVHNKILYKVLHLPETKAILTERENRFVRAHVPYTVSLTKEILEKNPKLQREIYENKDHWIIKPEDSYGSLGVHAGVEGDQKSWEGFLAEAMDQGYILQRFCTPYRLPNVDLLNEKPEERQWCTTSNLTGIFMYHGKMKGVYSRCSFSQMISTQYNEMTAASMVVEP